MMDVRKVVAGALLVSGLPVTTFFVVAHVNERDRAQRRDLCASAQDRYDTLRALIDVVTMPVDYPPGADAALKAAEDARNVASARQHDRLVALLDGRPTC